MLLPLHLFFSRNILNSQRTKFKCKSALEWTWDLSFKKKSTGKEATLSASVEELRSTVKEKNEN